MLVLKLSCKNLTTGIEVVQATPVVDEHMIELVAQVMMTNLGAHVDSVDLCLGLYELDPALGTGVARCTPSTLIAETGGPYMLNGTHLSGSTGKRLADMVWYTSVPADEKEPLASCLMRERDRSIRTANEMFISLVQKLVRADFGR